MKRYAIETRLTAGFTPSVMSLLGILARERTVPKGELIRAAVIAMLDSFAISDDIQSLAAEVAADTRRISDISGARPADFDPLDGIVVHRSVRNRFTSKADIYIDAQTAERLLNFCNAAQLSRAWAIRMAVDRYLFDEVTKVEVAKPGLSMREVLDGTSMNAHPNAEGAQRSEHQT